MSFLIVMLLLLVVMYVLMIRPQRQRMREQQRMIESAGVGDDILTTGGIYGTIIEVEGDDLVVEIADGVFVHMTRRAIAAVLPPEEEDEPDEQDAQGRDSALEGEEAAAAAGGQEVGLAEDAAAGERR